MTKYKKCPNCDHEVAIAYIDLEDEIQVCDFCGTEESDWREMENWETFFSQKKLHERNHSN